MKAIWTEVKPELSKQLKKLAQGINPNTGEPLDSHSNANNIEAVRLLFSLAEEFDETPIRPIKLKSGKLTEKDRRHNNVLFGRPCRSHFPWDNKEIAQVKKYYRKNNTIRCIASKLERSECAIAIQLNRLGLMDNAELRNYKR